MITYFCYENPKLRDNWTRMNQRELTIPHDARVDSLEIVWPQGFEAEIKPPTAHPLLPLHVGCIDLGLTDSAESAH